MFDDKMHRYIQLRSEITQMEGYNAILENHRLANSINIFDTNYVELIQLINYMEQNIEAKKLLSLQGHKQLHMIDIELLRRLHNFVAGAKSLVDHTRRIYNKYYKHNNIFPEYTKVVRNTFATDPLSQFVQDLREYCQHYRTLSLIYVTRFTRETQEEIREVALQVEDLLSYDGWSSTAKQYFHEKGDNIPISRAIQEYREKVLQFYKWFQEEQHRIHETALNEYKAKETEMILIQLEVQLNSIIANITSQHRLHPDSPFVYIFSKEDLQKLQNKPISDPDRLDYVLTLLNSYFPVPEHIRELIKLLYQKLSEINMPTQEQEPPA